MSGLKTVLIEIIRAKHIKIGNLKRFFFQNELSLGEND